VKKPWRSLPCMGLSGNGGWGAQSSVKPIQDGAFWGPGEGPWSPKRSAANVQKLAISGIKTKWHDYRGMILYILPKFVEDYNSTL
jgi:hypothetical protein